MKAWKIEEQTGTQALRLIDVEKPKPAENQILVRMTNPGVVPFDVATIFNENDDNFPPIDMPLIPGNQGTGIVEEAGITHFTQGDRVMFGAFPYGFMQDGSWAEYCVVEPDHAYPIPESLTDAEASQAVVAYPTAYRALMEAGFEPGKTVLAPAIGGSVGNATYQLARALGAGNVIGTAGSTAKAKQAQEAGFDTVIDLSQQSLPEGVRERNGGEGVDIVIDSLGGDILAEAAKSIVRYGKIICLGFAAGRTSEIRLADLILFRGSIQGYGVYTCTPEEWTDAWSVFADLVETGKVKPLLDRVFKFEDAPEALEYMRNARPFGAVALEL